MKKKRVITFALAAVLILSLGIAAYAAGFFSMNRRVPEKSETFRINWEENPSGYIDWSNAKLAVTFPETAESREIEFRPGWLPFTLPSTLAGSSPWENLDADTWFRRLTAEQLPLSGSPAFVPEYEGMSQPLLIESYSMSQFSNGGALLLLYFTPGTNRMSMSCASTVPSISMLYRNTTCRSAPWSRTFFCCRTPMQAG